MPHSAYYVFGKQLKAIYEMARETRRQRVPRATDPSLHQLLSHKETAGRLLPGRTHRNQGVPRNPKTKHIHLHINVHRGPDASGPHPLASIKCHPSWGPSDLHFSGPIFGVFSASFSGMFGTILEDIFRAPFHINHSPKLDPFWTTSWRLLGIIKGGFWAFLGRSWEARCS